MENYSVFPGQTIYQPAYQPNMYYQPTTTTPVYAQRNWQYQTQQPSTAQASQQSVGSMIWVQGEAGAKAYSNLQPGIPVALWDSEEQVIYIKSIDQSGKPQMTILDYVDRNAPVKEGHSDTEYVTKNQMDAVNSQLTSLNEKLSQMEKFATKDEINDVTSQLDSLGGQIEDIENRITSFGKPQQNSNSNNRRGNK